ncbi:hypothetical protein RHMOL_Rhmol06G0010900 [Rhododendron molle]|uniref:Uncharacterized protein n=1 Tax=Rhododendron molle TaxID=49168 RepID=A0ACC0N8C1_RHOML|nr:hypothetical protein RHMOL_Rhmol06G0010900 [Rhododendron molle]
MASVWCLNSHGSAAPFLSSEKPYRYLSIQCQSGTIIRRQVLFQTIIAAFSFPPIVSIALADTEVLGDFRLYSDEANKFKIMIPQDWQVGSGDNNGIKSVTGFFPAEPSKSNVTVAITGLGPDFTRLESFGKVDEFAETLVSGLDRSWQRPPGVKAKLIDSKAANGLYYIDYTLQNPGETRRHLFTVLGMATTGWYNRLYTVTGQYVDEDSEKYGSKIEKDPFDCCFQPPLLLAQYLQRKLSFSVKRPNVKWFFHPELEFCCTGSGYLADHQPEQLLALFSFFLHLFEATIFLAYLLSAFLSLFLSLLVVDLMSLAIVLVAFWNYFAHTRNYCCG